MVKKLGSSIKYSQNEKYKLKRVRWVRRANLSKSPYDPKPIGRVVRTPMHSRSKRINILNHMLRNSKK